MYHKFASFLRSAALPLFLFVLLASVPVVYAFHSWGPYHWARTTSSFTLKLGDNVSAAWDAYLSEASADWSVSSVLDTSIVAGSTRPKNCRPTAGRVEVCNAKYGNTGWLGIAQIWITGGEHITQGVAKMNDTYFTTASYNTPAWKRLVMCQEIAHTFGLDHQDEIFDNPNLGTCMDYTNNPSGPPSNEHPNAHDYEQLVTIYAHLDTTTTVGQTVGQSVADLVRQDGNTPGEWGRKVKDNGHVALFERDFGGGQKLLTYVIWAE